MHCFSLLSLASLCAPSSVSALAGNHLMSCIDDGCTDCRRYRGHSDTKSKVVVHLILVFSMSTKSVAIRIRCCCNQSPQCLPEATLPRIANFVIFQLSILGKCLGSVSLLGRALLSTGFSFFLSEAQHSKHHRM
jgi:hypothetical protein